MKLDRDGGIGKLLVEWWKDLDDDRGSRAVLRRASNLTEISMSAPYQRLYRRITAYDKNEELKPYHRDRLAAIAGLLAHIKDDVREPLAETMSKGEDADGRQPVSEFRFTRLLEAPDLDSLFNVLRRALPLIKYKADVVALANDVLNWGDKVKKNWAYSYNWSK